MVHGKWGMWLGAGEWVCEWALPCWDREGLLWEPDGSGDSSPPPVLPR